MTPTPGKGSRKRNRGSKRQPSSTSSDAVRDLAKTMEKESDRGCLLVGLAEIDNYLDDLLTLYLTNSGAHDDAKWLLDPKAGNRPLGNLAIRTRMAFCLGQIKDEVRGVIDAIREIRNDHAHGTANFEITESIVADVMEAWSDTNRRNLEDLAKGLKHPNKARLKLTLSIGRVLLIVGAAIFRLQNSTIRIDFTKPPRQEN